MIKKKVTLTTCLLVTGLLVAAEKKALPDYMSFKIVSPEQQLAEMMKKGFADIDARIDRLGDRIDSGLDKLSDRVETVEQTVAVLAMFFPEDQLSHIDVMHEFLATVVACKKTNDCFKKEEKRGFFTSGDYDVQRFIALFHHKNFISISPRHKEIISDYLYEVCRIVEQRLEWFDTSDNNSKKEKLEGHLVELKRLEKIFKENLRA
jgi:hypothetical protein